MSPEATEVEEQRMLVNKLWDEYYYHARKKDVSLLQLDALRRKAQSAEHHYHDLLTRNRSGKDMFQLLRELGYDVEKKEKDGGS